MRKPSTNFIQLGFRTLLTINILKIIIRLINRQLNKESIKNKVFCIGLHKTGTTTLANLALHYGFHPTHSTDWISNSKKLEKFDFLSDGGSHFDNINEFDFQFLFYNYPKALFILQTRNPEEWVISKLKHAGWDDNTIIEEDDINKITHEDWRIKSLLTIQKFLEHKNNYENKVIKYFNKNDPSRLIVIDITDKEIQEREVDRVVKYLNLKSINKIKLPHSNINQTEQKLSKEVLDYVKHIITTHNKK